MASFDSLVGATLGSYEVVAELGRGGMGVVYKARERALKRTVALKVLPQHMAEDPLFVKRFLREAQAAAQLNHPNIVNIYGIGEQDGTYFIVMEYIKGQTLKDHVRERGRLDTPAALEIARQTANALAEAHRQNIVHRDIKPQNIMIGPDGHVKVMDFGLAKLAESTTQLTMDGARLGTPLYMSPEQISGAAIDARTDLYALGVTLYEMLASAPPFEADTPLALMYQIVHQPFPDIVARNGDVSTQVAGLVAKMTAKDPNERSDNASALAEELAALTQAETTAKDLHRRAEEHFREGRPSESLAILDELSRSYPRSRSILFHRAVTLVKLDRRREALEVCDRLIEWYDDPRAKQLRENSDIPTDTGFSSLTVTERWILRWISALIILVLVGISGTFVGSPFGMEFVAIPAGSFFMGDAAGGKGHLVTISKSFQLSKYEITQGQWESVMGNNPSAFKGNSRRPVEQVSWNEVQKFITKLNARGAAKYRLPTEAEWEYACRGESAGAYYFGEDATKLGDYAWWQGNSGETIHPVGQKRATARGLYDMYGNVNEWVQDWYGALPSTHETDPTGPSSGAGRVVRGGSWASNPESCRSVSRNYCDPSYFTRDLGFRLVRVK